MKQWLLTHYWTERLFSSAVYGVLFILFGWFIIKDAAFAIMTSYGASAYVDLLAIFPKWTGWVFIVYGVDGFTNHIALGKILGTLFKVLLGKQYYNKIGDVFSNYLAEQTYAELKKYEAKGYVEHVNGAYVPTETLISQIEEDLASDPDYLLEMAEDYAD